MSKRVFDRINPAHSMSVSKPHRTPWCSRNSIPHCHTNHLSGAFAAFDEERHHWNCAARRYIGRHEGDGSSSRFTERSWGALSAVIVPILPTFTSWLRFNTLEMCNGCLIPQSVFLHVTSTRVKKTRRNEPEIKFIANQQNAHFVAELQQSLPEINMSKSLMFYDDGSHVISFNRLQSDCPPETYALRLKLKNCFDLA